MLAETGELVSCGRCGMPGRLAVLEKEPQVGREEQAWALRWGGAPRMGVWPGPLGWGWGLGPEMGVRPRSLEWGCRLGCPVSASSRSIPTSELAGRIIRISRKTTEEWEFAVLAFPPLSGTNAGKS